MRKKALKIYGYIISIGVCYWIFTAVTGILIPCFYLKTTGFLCPGCGITRMFLGMIKLDFSAAFRYNPPCFVLFFIWNIIGLLCIWGKYKFICNPKFLYTALGLTMLLLLIYGIVRNIY